jgi:hypothetical protein
MSFVEEAAIYVGILAVIILTGLGVTVAASLFRRGTEMATKLAESTPQISDVEFDNPVFDEEELIGTLIPGLALSSKASPPEPPVME